MVNASLRSFRLWMSLALCLTALVWLLGNGADASAAAPLGDAPARPVAQGEAEWTIMLYQDADDEVLERDIMIDFNEAERVGSTDQVNIVSQVDRFEGAFDGMGDWTSTKRFYLTQDDDLDEIGSEELEDLGEVNMADSQTLVDFITWAAENYPARKYALILSDHGAGWPGGWSDPDPGGTGADQIVLADMFNDMIWLMELDRALEEARAQTGIEQFEFIGFDACLMSQLEVFNAIAPHALYSVASQETEPALGWAYTSFLTELANNPGMDGAELSKHIVESYIDQDQRIVDDTARAAYVSEVYGIEGQVSPQEVAEADSKNITLTAVDLSAIPAVNAAVDNLAVALLSADPEAVAQARAYAQAFEAPFGEETPSAYIDLGNFAQLAVELSGDEQVAAAAEELYNSLNQAVIAEKHGPDRPGSTGLAIHFPTSELFGAADNLGYTTVAGRFAEVSRWDEFLAAFHSGGGDTFTRPDEAAPETAAPELPAGLSEEDMAIILQDVTYLQELGYTLEEIPQVLVDQGGYPPDLVQALVDAGLFSEATTSRSGSRSAAAAGPKPIEVEPLTLSAEVATPGAPVKIQTQLSGDRLAYVYSFIGRFLPREDALLIEDVDYLFADESKEVGGVTYPVWPKEGVQVEFDWEPTVYAVSDGKTAVKALIEPVAYDAETPTYAVGGTYRFASGGAPRFAKIYFRDGQATEIFGFTSSITQAVGAPRQISPKPGDQFTVLERGDDLTQEGDAGREKYLREGGTLTFGDQPFAIETTPAPSGNYVVGVIAEDLDGRKYEQYEGLFVVNEEASSVDGFKPYMSQDLEFALLYPEQWQVEENAADQSVSFTDAASSASVTISRFSYPDKSGTEANSQAIQDVTDQLSQNSSLENLQFSSDVSDYVLGAYDGQVVDFAYDLDGQPYSGYVVVSTPVEGTTYVVVVSAPDDQFDAVAADFDDMLYSFDILISGVSKEQAGPPVPDFADQAFTDDFSDPASGLINDEQEQEWGRGYYSPDGQYVFELKPAPGAIYDYYTDQTLPDKFLLQAQGSYSGAADNAYGLIFHVQVGEQSDEFYTFRISGDGFYTVEKTEGDQLTPVIDWTASSLIDQTEGAANVLAVEGQGDTYNLYINGRQVDAFTDATYQGGTFGFMVDNYDKAAPASFTFDELKVGAPATE